MDEQEKQEEQCQTSIDIARAFEMSIFLMMLGKIRKVLSDGSKRAKATALHEIRKYVKEETKAFLKQEKEAVRHDLMLVGESAYDNLDKRSKKQIKCNTFRPAVGNNGSITLGQTNALFYRLYAKNAQYVPSDIRLKTNIRKYDVRFENMYMELEPVIYEMKDEIGIGHCGLIAQQVKSVMNKYDISDEEFGVYEEDKISDTLGIIYPELTSLNMHMIQKTIKRIDTHDNEFAKLKNKIAELQSKLNAYILGEMEVRRA